MRRLSILVILLTSYLHAGMYGGIEGHSMSFDGTYKESIGNMSQEWTTNSDVNLIGLNLGYGYADSASGEIYLATNSEAAKFGLNFRYGFDMFDNNIFPHILLGTGFVFGDEPSLSNSPYTPYADKSDYRIREYNAVFIQLGIGLSYVLNDTIEFYGDAVLLFNLDDRTHTNNFHIYDGAYSHNIDVEQEWNNPSFGFQLGVKFHAFGSSTMRGKQLKDENYESEEDSMDNFL